MLDGAKYFKKIQFFKQKRGEKGHHKAFFVLFIFYVFLLFPFSSQGLFDKRFAFGEQTGNIEEKIFDEVSNQLNHLELDALEEYVSRLAEDNELFQGGIKSLVLKIISGEYDNDNTNFFAFLGEQMTQGLGKAIASLGIVVVVSTLLGIVTRNKEGIHKNTIGIVFIAGYALIITVVLVDVWILCDLASQIIEQINHLTTLVMPVLLTVMSAMGTQASVKAYQPSVALLCGGIIEFVSSVILPLAIFSIIFCVISNLSDNIRLDKVSSFFNKFSTTMLIIVFTVFSSFLTIQGISASSVDRVSVKAVKFATRSYVPIIGNYLSEGFDLILAGTQLIKNAIGIVALLIILGLIISPIIQIVLFSLALQLVAAVIQPVANEKVVNFLSGIAKCLTVLYVSIIAVAFMVIIILMLAVCSTNII